MKKIFIIGTIISVIGLSCSKKEETCPYNLKMKPTDSSLFISFDIEGHSFTFYQIESPFVNIEGSMQIINDSQLTLYSYSHTIEFGKFVPSNYDQYYATDVSLNFNNYSLIGKNEKFNMPLLSKEIESNYNFLACPENIELDDTIFLKGISIRFWNYSTDKVMSYFNYNIDSINLFYDGESYFQIYSMKEVCSHYIQIKGNFSTKVIYNDSPYYQRSMENGEFCFIVYQ